MSHHEVYLQVGLFFYAFSPGQCINCFRGTRVCMYVCVEKGSWQSNSTFSKIGGGKGETNHK